MKVLRIKIRQNFASYTFEEMVNNKRTYPLPAFSTVIGALHNACGYTEYKDMKVSVQGKYSSLKKEVYTNHGLIDNLHDDRGNLIWLHSSDCLSAGYILVAKALKLTGNSFKDEITINICNNKKLKEYQNLYLIKERLENYFNEQIVPKKQRLKYMENDIKKIENKVSQEYIVLAEKIKKEKDYIKKIEADFNQQKLIEYDEPRSHFKTLTKGPQKWETLYDVELVIHVLAEPEIMEDIIKNKNNFVSLGRSEDFIEMVEMKIVEISDVIDKEYIMQNGYAIYANIDKVNDDTYYKTFKGNKALGTVYNVSKEYKIEKKLRIFDKIFCLYSSQLAVDKESSKKGIYIDKNDKVTYIVDLN